MPSYCTSHRFTHPSPACDSVTPAAMCYVGPQNLFCRDLVTDIPCDTEEDLAVLTLKFIPNLRLTNTSLARCVPFCLYECQCPCSVLMMMGLSSVPVLINHVHFVLLTKISRVCPLE